MNEETGDYKGELPQDTNWGPRGSGPWVAMNIAEHDGRGGQSGAGGEWRTAHRQIPRMAGRRGRQEAKNTGGDTTTRAPTPAAVQK